MQEQSFQIEMVGMGAVSRLTRKLAHQIQDSNFQPDIVIAIARGGYVPARLLCDHLGLYNLTSLRIAHYTGTHMDEQARLSIPLNVNVHGMRVLLVDDIDDTGDTLKLAMEHIRAGNPHDVKISVLHHKLSSCIEPDYYAKKITRWRWITYPWAVIEDVLGLVKHLQAQPVTVDQAIAAIADNHGLRISEQIMEDVLRLL